MSYKKKMQMTQLKVFGMSETWPWLSLPIEFSAKENPQKIRSIRKPRSSLSTSGQVPVILRETWKADMVFGND